MFVLAKEDFVKLKCSSLNFIKYIYIYIYIYIYMCVCFINSTSTFAYLLWPF